MSPNNYINITLPAFDYIYSSKEDNCENLGSVLNKLTLFKEYYKSDSIIKSSVGEFYVESMDFFMNTLRDVSDMLSLSVNKTLSESDYFYSVRSLLPLGLLASHGYPDRVSCRVDRIPYIYGGTHHVLPEIQEFFKQAQDSCSKVISNDTHDFYKTRYSTIERIAHSICAGYIPQQIQSVEKVPNDSGFYKEYIIANILYPWVTQPVRQLRLLVPTLPKETLDHILEQYSKYPDETMDVGYTYMFDIVSDFITYLEIKGFHNPFPIHIQRQIWTSFMNFDIPTPLLGLDEELLERVKKCVKMSKKLYIEMLKTGLKYEAQYAVLCGFQGRFTMSGNIGAMLDFVNNATMSIKVKAVLDKIKGYIKL